MNDPFQAPQLCGMPEDQRAQRLPVQRPIRVQHRGAERPDDLAPGRFARLDDLMGQGIGIDNDCSATRKHVCDRAFAGRYSAGQAYQNHGA